MTPESAPWSIEVFKARVYGFIHIIDARTQRALCEQVYREVIMIPWETEGDPCGFCFERYVKIKDPTETRMP